MFIFIHVSDFDIIKQTVRRKWIEVKTTETRLKLFSYTIYSFYAKMTIRTKCLRVDVKWNINDDFNPWYFLLYSFCITLPFAHHTFIVQSWRLFTPLRLCSPFIKRSPYALISFIRRSATVLLLLNVQV